MIKRLLALLLLALVGAAAAQSITPKSGTQHFHSASESNRWVGDMVLTQPSGSEVSWVTPADGSYFAGVGTPEAFVVGWALPNRYTLADGTVELGQENDWPWGIGDGSDDNSLSCRYWTSSLKQRNVDIDISIGGVDQTEIDLGDSDLPADRESRGIGPRRWLLVGQGTTLTLYCLYVDGDGGANGPYGVHSASTTIGSAIDFDVFSRLTIGTRHNGFGNAIPTGLAEWWFAALPTGKALADVDLDTTAGVARYLVDAHTQLDRAQNGPSGPQFSVVRTLDVVDAGGTRLSVSQPSEAPNTVKLKCPISGVEAEPAGATGTLPQFRPPYDSLGRSGEFLSWGGGSPNGYHKSGLIVTGHFGGNGNNGFDYHVQRISAATRRRVAPLVPVPPGVWVDAATDYLGFYADIAGVEGHGVVNADYDGQFDVTYVTQNQHNETAADAPNSGETAYSSGCVYRIVDGELPTPQVLDFAGETFASGRVTASYNATATHGGVYYWANRVNGTTSGDARLGRWLPDQTTNEAMQVFAEAPAANAVYAGWCADFDVTRSGLGIVAWNPRIKDPGSSDPLGSWGAALLLLRLAEWGETDPWVFGARDGTDLTGSLGSISWADDAIYPVPGPAQTQLVNYDNGAGPALDPASLTTSFGVLTNGVHVYEEDGDTYVVLACDGTNDPDASEGFDDGARVRDQFFLSVFRLDPDAPRLEWLYTHDLYPAKQQVAPYANVAAAARSGFDYDHYQPQIVISQGNRLAFAVPRSLGTDESAEFGSMTTTNSTRYRWGREIGLVEVTDWHTASPTITATPSVAQASDYAGSRLMMPQLIEHSRSTMLLSLSQAGSPQLGALQVMPSQASALDLSSYFAGSSGGGSTAEELVAALTTNAAWTSLTGDASTAAGNVPPTVGEIRTEMETAGGTLAAVAATASDTNSDVDALVTDGVTLDYTAITPGGSDVGTQLDAAGTGGGAGTPPAFLDAAVPSEWVIPLADRDLGAAVDAERVVDAGESYIVAFDCRRVMAANQHNLDSVEAPTSDHADIAVVATTDPADPQWGKAGRYGKLQFTVAEGAASGTEATITMAIRPTAFGRVNAKLKLTVR